LIFDMQLRSLHRAGLITGTNPGRALTCPVSVLPACA
jgi:hypothetical protein